MSNISRLKNGSSVQVLITLDSEIAYVRDRLGNMQSKAPMVIRNAINKTAREAKKQDERLTKRTYTSKSDIHSLAFNKASTSNLEAILRDKGHNISMQRFKLYKGKGGISAIINTANGQKKLGKPKRRAFMADGTLMHGGSGVMVRSGKKRLPIEKLSSISSPVMHGNDKTWGTIEDDILQKLHDNIEKELERILSK